MVGSPTFKLDAAFQKQAAEVFLASTRLRKWTRYIETAESGRHVFRVHHDGPRTDLKAHRRLYPGQKIIPMNTKPRQVDADIVRFPVQDGLECMTAHDAAVELGQNAGYWLDESITSALIKELPLGTQSIEVPDTGMSKQTFIEARKAFLCDGHSTDDVLCAVLPYDWNSEMKSNSVHIQDNVYCEPLAAGVEIVFRPSVELYCIDEECQRGFIFMKNSIGWAERGWLSESVRLLEGSVLHDELNEHSMQQEYSLRNCFYGGGAVCTRMSGIIELKQG